MSTKADGWNVNIYLAREISSEFINDACQFAPGAFNIEN